MKKIVLLGSSAAHEALIRNLKSNNSSASITLIVFDGHLPYRRDLFPGFLAKDIERDAVFVQNKDFYAKMGVDVLVDAKISRINVKRRKIFFEDKSQLDFDVLVVGDTPENRYPSIKGTNKNGIYGYQKLKDMDAILKFLPLIDTVVLQSDTLTGIQAAWAFARRGKEVLLISSQKSFWTNTLETDVRQWLKEKLMEKGIEVIDSNEISEILGDKDLKAVRLKTGKIYSAQVVLFVETREDLRLFSDSEIVTDTKILVDEHFRSSVEGVYAFDQVGTSELEPGISFEYLSGQGRSVAGAITGESVESEKTVPVLEIAVEGISILAIGQWNQGNATGVRYHFDPVEGQYIKVFFNGESIIGSVLVNKKDLKAELVQAVKTGIPWVWPEVVSKEGDEAKNPVADLSCQNENVSTELVDN